MIIRSRSDLEGTERGTHAEMSLARGRLRAGDGSAYAFHGTPMAERSAA